MAVLARKLLKLFINDLTQFVHYDVSSKHMASTDELHGRQPRVERSNGEVVHCCIIAFVATVMDMPI
jgi:hypothetical protein